MQVHLRKPNRRLEHLLLILLCTAIGYQGVSYLLCVRMCVCTCVPPFPASFHNFLHMQGFCAASKALECVMLKPQLYKPNIKPVYLETVDWVRACEDTMRSGRHKINTNHCTHTSTQWYLLTSCSQLIYCKMAHNIKTEYKALLCLHIKWLQSSCTWPIQLILQNSKCSNSDILTTGSC